MWKNFVRYSGTENKLRIMVEGENKERVDYIADLIADTAIKRDRGILGVILW